MNISNKFRGCLVGGLLGDCLGAPFEGDHRISKSVLNSYFKRLLDPTLKVPYKRYTDDTVMAQCIASSMVDKKEFDVTDIAKRFVSEYYSEPRRGYGGNVLDVFATLRATKFQDVFAPAALQFGGTGSYGNGAAMRVAPVALFCFSESTDVVAETAKKSSLTTHANRLGYNGAILQCIAVHEALKLRKNELNSLKYLESLISHMRKYEKYAEDEIIDGTEKNEFVYVPALEKIKLLLEKGDVSTADVVSTLGNNVSAQLSVPTAIYVFLRAQTTIEGVETNNVFQRTIHYAISLGGDTDTIATMAGNIAGAYYGIEEISENLQRHCEGLKNTIHLAHELYLLRNSTG